MVSYQHILIINLLVFHTIFQSIHLQYGLYTDELEIFKFFYDMKDGYYADVGGFDPVIYSTSIYLYGRGWKGINFEANWVKANRFPYVKTADVNANIAVGEGGKYLTLYQRSSDLSV
jgi:hypothetical protein